MPPTTAYAFAGQLVPDLTDAQLTALSTEPLTAEARDFMSIQPTALGIDVGTFARPDSQLPFPAVTLSQHNGNLTVDCSCEALKGQLCEHQTQVLLAVRHRQELRAFFDAALRRRLLVAAAQPYGLEKEPNLEEYFGLRFANQKLEISPRLPGLFPLTQAAQAQLSETLLPRRPAVPRSLAVAPPLQRFVVLGKHKYYDHLSVHLFEAALTAAGKPKNPLAWVPPLEASLACDDLETARFYTSVSQLQHQQGERSPAADLAALRALVRNPLGLPVFTSEAAVSEKETAQALRPLVLRPGQVEVQLLVQGEGLFKAMTAKVLLNGDAHELNALSVKHGAFVALGPDTWYLVERPEVLRVLAFFKARHNVLLLHRTQFPAFQEGILTHLEHHVSIRYADLPPATPNQLVANGFAQAPEMLLYLSEAGKYVEVVPVMKYGTIEVPVLSRKVIYATDAATNKAFLVPRDAEAELRFLALLVRQQPAFEEQLGQEAFSLPRRQFLDEGWFLDAFEAWQQHGITVLGFNELPNNRLNPHKATVTVRVGTEANWFDTELDVRFGKQKVPLASLQKALRNQSKYVTLGDGTQGLLPQEWLDRFARYFAAGELAGERIRTPKINFAAVRAEYEPEALTDEARAQLAHYEAKVARFAGVEDGMAPAALQGTLRPYQQHGLNWLNFLDSFDFGGCLADDMGLGKTITVLAFLLEQRAKSPGAATLIVVPTSLVFNWQAEAARFAPTLRLLTAHGPDRAKTTQDFANYDLVLTTYGSLLTDVVFLKDYRFNYIFLDESQAIKNPESQRYLAARQLQSRNKVVLTGTPIENNTYDLYGQLSFACPGLLGSQHRFKTQYATPIDKFKSTAHALALRRKIDPFVLRRTKQQVAAELPAKTEMVLHCPMETEQRQVYDQYKKLYRDQLMGLNPELLPKKRLHILQGLTKLRQICDSPALLSDEVSYGSASAKLHVLLREVESKAPQHKILIFSQFVAMLDLIREALTARGIAAAYLTGQTKNRAAVVAEFQENPALRVFLISLKAGGTGLNLTEADYVYLVDPWWNPAVENQAIDRSHRLGQTKPVVAVRLICPDTIEEKIQKLQADKRLLADDLVRTDTSVLNALSASDLLNLFS